MSIALYYSATRSSPLTPPEADRIAAVQREFAGTASIEEYGETGAPHAWQSFRLAGWKDDPQSILAGSIWLPTSSEEAVWNALQHWCRAVTAFRRALPDADWRVHFEDLNIHWDEALQEYDPSRVSQS